jgi:serine phosphatase RsbU (regulator of sigma subunit)
VSGAVLQIRRGDTPPRVVPLEGERMIVGRSPKIEVVLESDTVSRQHMELVKDDQGNWWVRDLHSRNGTLVNGARVVSHRLSYGDVIQVEDYFLTYAGVPGEAARRPTVAARLTMVDGPIGPVRSLRELGAPKIDASQLSRLIALGGELLATEEADARVRILCELMVDRDMHGTAALAIRIDRAGAEEPALLRPPSLAAGKETPHISRTVLRAVLASGAPVVASTFDGGKDLLKMSLMVEAMSAVAVPIGGAEGHLDTLYVTLPSNYGTAEWLALVSLAGELYRQAESTWAARRQAEAQAVLEEELGRARDIQTRLVPRDFHTGKLDVGFAYEACKWVGGDYVDALPLRDGRLLITVMDVCGKGLEAALIAAGLHTTVHVLVHEGLGVGALVRSLNRYLCATLPAGVFVTMCSLVIDPDTGAIEHVNCGHPPPMIADAGGALREVDTFEQAPLGFLDVDAEIVVTRDRLEHGELLVLYSDGLSELLDEQDHMLGVEALAAYVTAVARDSATSSATQLGARLRERLAAYRGNAVPADDASFILVLRPQPSQSYPTSITRIPP